MPLDLSGSVAKIARARDHLNAAERVHSDFIRKNKPYTIDVVGPNDATDGWCSVFLVGPHKVSEPLIGIIVGDCIHNLRCALNYIIVALVEASGEQVWRKHQFPIFDNREDYLRLVGTETAANADGILKGVTIGLKEIWALQPFHREANIISDALYCIHRFSNADKHRIISTDMHLAGPGGGYIESSGRIIEIWDNPNRITLGARGYDEKFEVCRRRYAKPYPRKISFNAKISVDILVGTPAFGKYPTGLALTPELLYDICDYVAMITETFKAL